MQGGLCEITSQAELEQVGLRMITHYADLRQ